MSQERFEELEQQEEILLTVTDGGFGRRSSAYDYRVSGRGCQGITNMTFSANRRGKEVVGTLPTLDGTDVMLVTDTGRLIRLPVSQVRVMARPASGGTLFRPNQPRPVSCVFPAGDEDGEEGELKEGLSEIG